MYACKQCAQAVCFTVCGSSASMKLRVCVCVCVSFSGSGDNCVCTRLSRPYLDVLVIDWATLQIRIG